jgi:hypothetical protein
MYLTMISENMRFILKELFDEDRSGRDLLKYSVPIAFYYKLGKHKNVSTLLIFILLVNLAIS